jgi:hypothetical protein
MRSCPGARRRSPPAVMTAVCGSAAASSRSTPSHTPVGRRPGVGPHSEARSTGALRLLRVPSRAPAELDVPVRDLHRGGLLASQPSHLSRRGCRSRTRTGARCAAGSAPAARPAGESGAASAPLSPAGWLPPAAAHTCHESADLRCSHDSVAWSDSLGIRNQEHMTARARHHGRW